MSLAADLPLVRMDNPVRIKMEEDDDYAGAGNMFGVHTASVPSHFKASFVKKEPCEAAAAAGEKASRHYPPLSSAISRHYPPLPNVMTSDAGASFSRDAMGQKVNNNGGAHESNMPVGIKTPKYSGKSDWEAFHAQFELLAHAYAWSEQQKALQLALCLTDDALSCLLLLDTSERADYGALVGALRRRFGQCFRSELLRSELHNRQRIPGEPLRALANDIESLARRAYAHIPPSVQSELARDQFIRAHSPAELCIHTQLARPRDLAEALELALEREMAVESAIRKSALDPSPTIRATGGGETASPKPEWLDEITEMIRGLALPSPRRQTQTRLCWGCGQPGHLVRECPVLAKNSGNRKGAQ